MLKKRMVQTVLLLALVLPALSARAQAAGGKCVIFYETMASTKQMEDYYLAPLENSLHQRYGAGETVYATPVSTAQELTGAWNAMDDAGGIDCVIYLGHGSAEQLCGLQFGACAAFQLQDKRVETMLLLSCNAGHLDYDACMARAFASKPGVARVIAPDGTVQVCSGDCYFASEDGKWKGLLAAAGSERQTSAGWVQFHGAQAQSIAPEGEPRTVEQLLRAQAGPQAAEKTLTLAPEEFRQGGARLPLRKLAEWAGASVEYDGQAKRAILRYRGQHISLTCGQSFAVAGGRRVCFGREATLENGRLYAPPEFFFLVLGQAMRWQGTALEVSMAA